MRLNKLQIQNLQKLKVRLAYLFGSHAEGKSLSFSDVDIGLVFRSEKMLDKDIGEIYNQLYDIFTDVFRGKKVDIVFLHKASLELRFDAMSHGKVLYAGSNEDRFDFEEKTMLLYADFKPILEEFNRAILNRN